MRAVLALAAASLWGCGARLAVHDAPEVVVAAPIAGAADIRIAATLKTVIVPNGKGAWAFEAEWDEYRIELRSLSGETATFTAVLLVDALGTRIATRAGRPALAEGSRETEQRYAASGQLGKGSGGSWMILGGTAAAVGGGFAGSAAAMGSVMSMGAASGSAATAMALGPVVMAAGAVVVASGVVQMRNNAAIDRTLLSRQTRMPVFVAPGRTAALDLFFPVTPLPQAVEVVYMDSKGEHRLAIDTRTALALAHASAPQPTAPGPRK